MVNRVVLIGRMVRNPELKTTTSGKSVVSFTIAVNKRIKPQDPSEPDAHFFRVQAWGQTTEYVANYLGKGRLVVVDGRLEQRSWTDSNGQKRDSIEVVADSVSGLDRPRDDAPKGEGKATELPRNESDYDPFDE